MSVKPEIQAHDVQAGRRGDDEENGLGTNERICFRAKMTEPELDELGELTKASRSLSRAALELVNGGIWGGQGGVGGAERLEDVQDATQSCELRSSLGGKRSPYPIYGLAVA